MEPVGGVVLCGGQSRRMGRPKAWLPVGEETMLGRVVRLLSEVVAPIVVVAAPDQEVPPLSDGVTLVRDAERGHGPLEGIAAGLTALQGKVRAAYVSSCDVPLLRESFVRRMIELLGDHTICVPEVGGYHHPLAAVYRVEVANLARELLNASRYRPVFLFESVATRIVQPDELHEVDPQFDSLRNLNTPEEYAAALAVLTNPGEGGWPRK